MADKKINLRLFIKGYDTAIKKDEYVMNNIKVVNYLPFNTKLAHTDNIVRSTMRNKEGEVASNTSLRKILSIMDMLNEYTNLNIILKYNPHDVHSLRIDEQYDMLNERGLIEPLLSLIPQKERMEWESMVSTGTDDYLVNNLSTESFVSKQITRVLSTVDNTLDVLIETLKHGDTKNLVRDVVDSIGLKTGMLKNALK